MRKQLAKHFQEIEEFVDDSNDEIDDDNFADGLAVSATKNL